MKSDARCVFAMLDVWKSFPTAQGRRQDILKGVNLEVRNGEFVMITGPSGAGKTTLLNLAALLERPTQGKVLFDGENVTDKPESDVCAIRKWKIGMVFQRFHLLPHRTALENIVFRFRYTNVATHEALARAEEALRMLGLVDVRDRPVRLLSSGEMQRVAIARAVVLPPKLLLADEPTGNLDGRSALQVMEALELLHRQGITILMVTHNERLLHFCSRHLRCEDGVVR